MASEGSVENVDWRAAERRCRLSKGPFRFEAAHRLLRVPEGHPCGRRHGHSYQFWVEVEGPVDYRSGWVVDFAAIGEAARAVERELDHQDLNALPYFVPEGRETTAENLAHWLLDRLLADAALMDLVAAVRVSETHSTWAEARVR